AIVAYSGVDTTTPIDVENGQATSSGTTHSTPSITTTVANAMLVASFGLAGTGTWTPPAGIPSDQTLQPKPLPLKWPTCSRPAPARAGRRRPRRAPARLGPPISSP